MLTNAEVREALKGSIAKWKAIANGTGNDDGIIHVGMFRSPCLRRQTCRAEQTDKQQR